MAVQDGSLKGTIKIFNKIVIFKGFGEGLGRVLGGVGEGLGRDLGRVGWILRGLRAIWALWGLFARFCMYFQAFYAILHILDQSSNAKPCFTFSSFRLHASTAQIIFRSSRSLLRQVSQVGLVDTFLALFFELFFNIDFDTIFLRFWRGFGGQFDSQNRLLGSFLNFFLAPLSGSSFLTHFNVFFNAQLLKNKCFV